MNTYDFDETIYYGDSEFHFIEYIFKKYPLEMKKYYDVKRPDDVIISATPSFILEPIAKTLGNSLIGTLMNKKTGELTGTYNFGEEKVRRFKEIYGDVIPEKFYSDSPSDSPMANYANEAFLVTGDEFSPWKG